MDDSLQLRQRAAVLRHRADVVRNSSAFVLPQRSGDDVWMGPTATHLRDDLTTVLARLRSAAEELQMAAVRLEARAQLADADLLGRAPK